MSENQTKRLLTVKETAVFLGMNPRTIYNKIGPKAKTPFPVRPKRINGRPYWDIRDLNEFVDSL